ncbi:MAG TPA: AAA family ATPase [Caldimonas sp.]|jgi:MSHA biogenesis protein MshM|nr:AAA family ATPase [Caldimonas sp.]HEV7577376.1 AAA family ATPase [Caldimonas sp.]
MYLAHFGLSEPPFALTPDTAYAFSTRAHQEALNTLLVAADAGEGFIKITGEVGTGKTLLCRRFLAALAGRDAGFVTCYLPNPNLSPRTLMLSLAEELGETLPASADQYTLHKTINQRLLEFASADLRVVLCLDEAQALSLESLEALRLLSNLETEKRKLMQVVLFGQPELDTRLQGADLRQLRQRIAFAYRLHGLSRSELGFYVEHRLRVAGHVGASIFAAAAIARLHRASAGTPRLVNILAHKALLAVYGEGGNVVERRHVRAAERDSDAHAAPRRGWLGWRLR